MGELLADPVDSESTAFGRPGSSPGKATKYSREFLLLLVKDSKSISEVMRKLNLKPKKMFYLTCFCNRTEGLLTTDLLVGVGENEVREVFKLHPGEFFTDLIVEEEQLDWLAKHGHPELDLDAYTYFVELTDDSDSEESR